MTLASGDEVLEIMTGKGEAIGDRDKQIKNVGMNTGIPEEKMETDLFLISNNFFINSN